MRAHKLSNSTRTDVKHPQPARFFCEEALDTTNFKLSPLATYFIPEPGALQGYRDYIATLPLGDRCAFDRALTSGNVFDWV